MHHASANSDFPTLTRWRPQAADQKIQRSRTARPLSVSTCVLVQWLVAKPEHNGTRERMLSLMRTASGRYAVALDVGKELSLKAEWVARAGGAVAGCASEEASSVRSRCQDVWYC